MTLSDLEWLSDCEIFNDTKHRAVSLQQLSFSYLPSSLPGSRACFGWRTRYKQSCSYHYFDVFVRPN